MATLDGTQTRVKVPEGTQNGRQFRLKGKGMPVLRQPNVGDLYIQTAVETPQNLTKRQRELLEEFEKLSSKDNSPAVERLLRPHEGLFRIFRRKLRRSIGRQQPAAQATCLRLALTCGCYVSATD